LAPMQETHCPICFGKLEVRELAPCDDCGAKPDELEHLKQRKHSYTVYEVFPGLELTLCDSCCVDFTSYNPDFFGLPKDTKIGLGTGALNLIRSLDQPPVQLGKVCTQCGLRLTFARFVVLARKQHAQELS
jgi:hypothetical protein